MADGYASRIDNLAYPSAAERLLDSVAFMPGASGILPRPGVKPGAAVTLSVLTGPDRVTVPAHGGVLLSTPPASATLSYVYVLPAAVTKSFATRPGAGTSRIDLIVVRVYDAGADSSTALKELDVEIIPGTAATTGSQVAPTQPNGTLLLGTATVPNSAAIVITTPPPRTVTTGGVVPVANATDLGTLVPYDGMMAYQEDTDVFYGRVNGAWKSFGLASTPTSVIADAGLTTAVGTGATWVSETGTGSISQAFVATTTTAKVSQSAYVQAISASADCRFGYKLSGGLTRDPLPTEAVAVFSSVANTGQRSTAVFTLTGLTIGATYTFTSAVYCGGVASVYAQHRRLLIEAI